MLLENVSCIEVYIQLYKNWMTRKLHLIFLMFSTTFNILHCLYSLWFLFSIVKLFCINIVSKTVIFYRINCSQFKEGVFWKTQSSKHLPSLQFCREAQFFSCFNDFHRWGGGGSGAITNDVLNFRKVIGFLKFIYVI